MKENYTNIGILTSIMLMSILSCKPIHNADTIFINGKIITVDENFSIAEAVAIKEAKIIAVGSNNEIKKYAGLHTKIINVERRTIVPGLIDAHCHPENASLSELEEEIPDVHTITELLEKTTIESAQREYNTYNKPVKRYHSFEYKANSWAYPERVVVKVEANSMGTNIRFIVSSLKNVRSKALYEQGYCARGAAELRIKGHKTYLLSDRMSCNSFKANQFRLFLHSAAYVLIHSLQQQMLKGTEFCKAAIKTIQLKIIKTAARVKIMKTKVQIELPAEFYSKHYIILFNS